MLKKQFYYILPVFCLLCGSLLLVLGIQESISASVQDWATTTGYLNNSYLYEQGRYDAAKKASSADTYKLIYSYTVGNQEYMLTTDYATAFVPAVGSETEIRYNPENPEEAVVGGPSQSNRYLIFFGMFFIIIPLFFLLPNLAYAVRHRSAAQMKKKTESKRKKKKGQIDYFGVGTGLVLIVFGYGALCMIAGTYSIPGIAAYFASSFTVPLFIPLLLIAAGIFLLVKLAFFKKTKR